MDTKEAKKAISKHNKLRKEIERLRDRLWHEPINGRGFELCKKRIREVEKELEDNYKPHLDAIKVFLCKEKNN